MNAINEETYIRDSAEAIPHAVPRTKRAKNVQIRREFKYRVNIPFVPKISGVHLPPTIQ
jgi:hypothetical protein